MKRSTLRLSITLFVLVLALVLTGCGWVVAPTPRPATVVAATDIPTVAVPTVTTTSRATETPVVATLDPAMFDPATLDPITRAAVDDFLTTAYGGEPFQGALLVARGGEILMRQGLGMADRSAGLANGPDTRFRLGSLTKPFTALAILKLHAQGKLALDAPICPYLDPCPAAWQPITVHDLLAHTSGIPDFAGLPDFAQFKVEATTPAQTIARVANRPLDFAPGSSWQYSNSNYIILGAISGKDHRTELCKLYRGANLCAAGNGEQWV